MSPAKRTLPPEELRAVRRAAAEGVGGAARKQIGEPASEGFADGVEARRTLDGLLREEDIGESLHGPDRVVRFPRYLIELFAHLDPAKAENLLTLASLTPAELHGVIKLARREADRTVFGRVWSRAWKIGLGIAVPTYGLAKWGVEQIPFVREIIALFRGTTP